MDMEPRGLRGRPVLKGSGHKAASAVLGRGIKLEDGAIQVVLTQPADRAALDP